jgi:hypothetical protein
MKRRWPHTEATMAGTGLEAFLEANLWRVAVGERGLSNRFSSAQQREKSQRSFKP